MTTARSHDTRAARERLAAETADPSVLRSLLEGAHPFLKSSIGRNPACPADILTEFAASPDKWLRDAAAGNPHTPGVSLRLLAADYHTRVLTSLLHNRACPSDVLEQFVDHRDWMLREKVAAHPNTPTHALVALVGRVNPRTLRYRNKPPADSPHRAIHVRRNHGGSRWQDETIMVPIPQPGRFPMNLIVAFSLCGDAELRQCAAEQPDAPIDVLVRLATDHQPTVRAALVRNPSTPTDVLLALIPVLSADILGEIALRPGLTEGIIEALVNASPSNRVARNLALNAEAQPLVVGHPAAEVRRRVARHATPEQAVVFLADAEEGVQVAAAKSLGLRSLEQQATHACAKVRQVVAQGVVNHHLLHAMAADTSALVRRAVADNPCTVAETLTLLAEDPDRITRKKVGDRLIAALSL